ncbi:unnamed protein product, partial [Oppiella nova]
YHTYLPGYSLELLYKTLCKEGSRTLLLLRDGTVEINNNKCENRTTTDFSISPESENNSNVFDIKQSGEDTDQTLSSPSTSSPEDIPNNETLLLTANPANDEQIDNVSVVSGDGYQSDNWSIASHKHQR